MHIPDGYLSPVTETNLIHLKRHLHSDGKTHSHPHIHHKHDHKEERQAGF